MLSPNALRILDRLGVYSRLSSLGYSFQNLYFRSEDDKPLDTFSFGNQDEHGYDGLRVYRFELIKVLLEMLSEADITPVYGMKFVQVLEEDESGVTWQFDDGSTGTASLLVGADGIHSRVRKYVHPDVVPKFTNMIGVTAAVPTSQIDMNSGGAHSLPVTIMNKKYGAFIIAPQRKDGSEMLIGKQRRVSEEPDRQGWERMHANKQWCVDFLREGLDEYPSIVSQAVADISPITVNLWPFYVIPKLDSWISKQARVVVLGDAAHAIPPTAGQGVNQAFEDVYSFALIMSRLGEVSGSNLSEALGLWQRKRQERVDGVLDLNGKLNKRRLPAELGEQEVEAEDFDMKWLYNFDFEAMVDEIIPPPR